MRALAVVAAVVLVGLPAIAGDLPDPKLTPGKARDDLSLQQICSTAWGTDERLVTEGMKKAVMAAYHMTPASCPSGKIEIDHLVSRELGGADDVANLWPQCYEQKIVDRAASTAAEIVYVPPSHLPEWGAHKKDRLENDFGKRICLPSTDPQFLSLATARAALTADWTLAYIERFGDPRTLAKTPSP